MSNLANKTVVVVGGSSGIGFGIALAALQSLASKVIIASSDSTRLNDAVERLRSHNLPGEVIGEVLDAKDAKAIKAFATGLGDVDHIAWTSGDSGPANKDIQDNVAEHGNAVYTVRFWGPFILAQNVKIRPGGSLTFTSGVSAIKNRPGMAVWTSLSSALDGLARGLAVDLAPVRVNVVSPGAINTERFERAPAVVKELVNKGVADRTLIKRLGEPHEMAEAYIFLMKCGYITGQTINVEGGLSLT